MIKKTKNLILILVMTLFSSNVLGNYEKLAYEFKFQDLDGSELKLSEYKDKVVIIVNVASRCGFTSQYEDMQTIWDKYQNKGVVMIGVPSNDFGNQELSENKKVKEFCTTNFNITFLLTEITKIKGKNGHPFFKWVNEEAGFLAFPKWNFYKYLINKNGELVSWYASVTKPNSNKIIKAIEKVILDK